MPIPRKKQNEFFISEINKLYINEPQNQAIIYQPDESISISHFGESLFILMDLFRLNYSDQLNNDRRLFISNMTDLFPRSNNTSDNLHLSIILDIFRGIFLDDYIRRFLMRSRSDDLLTLTYEFYSYVDHDNEIRQRIGNDAVEMYKTAILNYYNNLQSKEKKQEKSRRKMKNARNSIFNKQFKEFKVHQSYINKKLTKEMIHNATAKRLFINQHKYRKLRHLRRAIPH